MQNTILTCPIPTNVNTLKPNGYQFALESIPSLSYFCQEVQLPSVDLGTTETATPFAAFPMPGDRLAFGDLTVQFLIDADMANYKALFDWIQGLGFPEMNSQYSNQVRKDIPIGEVPATVSDATLSILGNNNRPIRYIRFIDCFPVSLSSVTFTSTSQDVQYLVGNVTFKYSYFKFDA